MKKILVIFLFPFAILADSHLPYYKSLSKDESWLRHYPNLQDFKEQTEKFFLTQKRMPVKIIEEFQSTGSDYIDWYHVEFFNGIEGWINHTQLTRKRSLLILEKTEFYAFKSIDPNSILTIQKGEILSPKIVNLLKVTPTMFKISVPTGKQKEIKGWIPRDYRVWGDDPKEIEKNFD